MAPGTVIDDSIAKVTAPSIVEALRLGDLALFETRLAAMTGLGRARLQANVYRPHGRDLAAICRSLGLEKLIFASIFLLSQKARAKVDQVDPRRFAKAMAFYESLSEETARATVARWRRDDGASE